ncbi:MAG: hypothetical protein PHC91_06325 [Eubacteriales bacterium]|nr:hypothetical protein [Eubacteriales bacterium]
MWKHDNFKGPPSQAELRRRAEQSKSRSAGSGKVMDPVMITGRQIAGSWWGQAWCANLEKYADYRNRVGRGKNYVRAGAVIDLKLEGGIITAKVQGSKKTPYKVEVKIDPIPEARYQAALKSLSSRIENIEALVNGNFPLEMKSLFTGPKSSLFPSPREIHFTCSCPDWASMCKHVAAVLYGIGNRLDHDPLLFFTIRGIEVSDFIQWSVEEKLGAMLKNADRESPRIIEDQSLKDLFGVLE